MNLLDIFGSKKQEALKTDELRRKTQDEIAKTKGALDDKFAHLSQLVDSALIELSSDRRQPALHPKRKQ